MIRNILTAFRGRPPELQRIVGKRPYPLDELMLMTAAFGALRPDVVVEVGTHAGKSARVWWELSRLFGC